jgi:hypothetical protein
MPSIHFVERKNNVHRVQGTTDEWESGYWVVGHDTADRLVGGELYLHAKQDAESHFGGRILSWRAIDDPTKEDIHGRLVFRIRFTPAHRGVKVGPEGWGNEKNLRW